jgi:hypothetical protein
MSYCHRGDCISAFREKVAEMTRTTTIDAFKAIAIFTNGLEGGVKYYDNEGKELKSVKEIIETLQEEGSVSVKFPDGVEPPWEEIEDKC